MNLFALTGSFHKSTLLIRVEPYTSNSTAV